MSGMSRSGLDHCSISERKLVSSGENLYGSLLSQIEEELCSVDALVPREGILSYEKVDQAVRDSLVDFDLKQ